MTSIKGSYIICTISCEAEITSENDLSESGGTVVGILPGDRKDANPYVGISVATGMSHARNAIIVRSSDAVIALPGEYGTLSEIALALKMNRAVISLGSWDIAGTLRAKDPREAIELLSRLLRPGIA